jgi:hypothetical protein
LLLATDSLLPYAAHANGRIRSAAPVFPPFAKKSRPRRRPYAIPLPRLLNPSHHLSLFSDRVAALAAAPIATLALLAVLNIPIAALVTMLMAMLAAVPIATLALLAIPDLPVAALVLLAELLDHRLQLFLLCVDMHS